MSATIPARAGLGLRTPHYREILATRPDVGWFEVHSENYFGDGGQPLWFLGQIRERYPVSLHGVGLSLGRADRLDAVHLRKLRSLADRVEPGLVSEHLCWGAIGGSHLNDLLPLPYTEEALQLVCRHVDEAQAFLGRRILIENISSYLQFSHSTISEWDFLAALAARTGCGILLDVNNIYVSACNHRFDPTLYLDSIAVDTVKEIHLAGFERHGDMLIDTHGTRVSEAVWRLYHAAIQRFPQVPTLIEWDTDIPPLSVLIDEASRADHIAGVRHAIAA